MPIRRSSVFKRVQNPAAWPTDRGIVSSLVIHARSSTLTCFDSLQASLDQELETIHALIETFKQFSAKAIANMRRQRNTLSPISTLPTEMFVTIFDYYLQNSAGDSPADDYPARLATLSEVSWAWRTTMQTTPQLWSQISTDHPPSFVRKALKYSKTHPIKIHGSLSVGASNEKREEAVLDACSQLSRWASADVSVSSNDDLDMLTYSGAGALKRLALLANPTVALTPVKLFKGHTPQLQYLRLGGAFDWTSLQINGLTTLHLLSIAATSATDFLQSLGTCTNLRELRLGDLRFPSNHAASFPIPSRIELPFLAKLRILRCSLTVITTIISNLLCPASQDVGFATLPPLPNSLEDSHEGRKPLVDFIVDYLGRGISKETDLVAAVGGNSIGLACMRKSDMEMPRKLKVISTDGHACLWTLMEDIRQRFPFDGTLKIQLFGSNKHDQWRLLDRLPAQTLLDTDGFGIAAYLATPKEDEGVARWPLPNLTTVRLGANSCKSATTILDMVRSRIGRTPSPHGSTLELPKPLKALRISKGCPMDSVTFLKIRAVLADAEVVWEEEPVVI